METMGIKGSEVVAFLLEVSSLTKEETAVILKYVRCLEARQAEVIEIGEPVVSETPLQHTRVSLKNQIEIGEPEIRRCYS